MLEDTDFAASDIRAALHAALLGQPTWNPAGIAPAEVIVEGLALAIDTPLGPLAGERRLGDIGRRDRLDELTFELPLAGGDTPSADVGLRALADLLEQHLAPDDPVAGYAAHLRDPRLDHRLRGYLTGSIDAVLRFTGDGPARFAVVDYKTNWLAPEGTELTSWHYRPAALAAAMQHAHYPLQALLYVVALHRFLRWRVAGYDPDEHLAGVLYLFLRGMVGPTTPRQADAPYGVFAWRPPAALVTETSDLLDRGARG